jgi:hypothetical protein
MILRETTKRAEVLFMGMVLILISLTFLQSWVMYDAYVVPSDEPGSQRAVIAFLSTAVAFYIYAGFGLFGIKMAEKIGFPLVWGTQTTWIRGLLIPVLLGAVLAGGFIGVDSMVNSAEPVSALPQPALHISLISSLTSSIGEEVIFRLFLIPFVVWLIAHLIFRKSRYFLAFLIATAISTVAFSTAHVFTFLDLSRIQETTVLSQLVEWNVLGVNILLSLSAAWLLRRDGFLPVVILHLTTDIVWTIVYGSIL